MNSVTDVQQAARDGFYGKGVQTTIEKAEQSFASFADGREDQLKPEELEILKTGFIAGYVAASG